MIGDEDLKEYMRGIVGNEALRKRLCEDVIQDKLPHALIIQGPCGSGKHTIAKNLAAALACERKNADGAFPCGECVGCKKVFGDKCPDVKIIGREKDKAFIVVDTIRALREDVPLLPNDLEHKMYIIEEADRMNEQAQNALLLTLEEPPSFVRFVLLCERADRLLETIRSRAPVLHTEGISNDRLDEYICKTDRRAAQLKMSSRRDYEALIASAKHGIGTALSYLEDGALTEVLEKRRLVTSILSEAQSRNARNTLPLIFSLSPKKGGREKLSENLLCLAEATHDLVLLKRSDDPPLSFFFDRAEAAELADGFSLSFLYELELAVLIAIDSNSKNANIRVTLTKLASDGGLI